MARRNIKNDPSEKLFEEYLDFSGGLNSETANERLRDNEFPVLDNIDLGSRGSAKRRTGRTKLFEQVGNAQGMFPYYRKGQDKPDIILAIQGKLYRYTDGDTSLVPIVMKDGALEFSFQTTLPIEAVQYVDNLFIATGTKLMEMKCDPSDEWKADTSYSVGDKVTANGNVYSCTIAGISGSTPPSHTSGTSSDNTVTWSYIDVQWKAVTVTPYNPTSMEAIYIGTNALMSNPNAYITDGTATSLEVAGIVPGARTGAVNKKQTFTGYYNKPSSITSLDYLWEYKRETDTVWLTAKTWTTGTAGKTCDIIFDTAMKWDIRLSIRDTSDTTNVKSMTITNYVVNETESKENTPKNTSGIQSCRRILLHWDRILLYGDSIEPTQLYISDLNSPRYFPTTNTIPFDTGKREPISSIIRYRDYLVVFTKTTIQTLIGRSPEDYEHGLIHDGIGCISERSPQVVGNNIFFLSTEGVHMLRPNQFVLETLNVFRVDQNIKSNVSPVSNACSMVYDSQYWLCFPDEKIIYRCYFEEGIWVRDTSPKLDFAQFLHYGGEVYELSKNGILYKQNRTVYNDDGHSYDMKVEFKYLDLSASFNYKKLKRLYVLARHFSEDVNIGVKVMADSSIVLTPDKGVVNIINGSAQWEMVTEPNMHFYTGTTVGSWIMGKTPLGHIDSSVQKAAVRGKCRRVKVIFEHSEDSPCEIFGFGLEFKAKKP